MADSEWEQFKPEIKRLYCDEKKTRKEIQEYMESTHAFKRSDGQYQRQFKKWGFEKSLKLSSNEWSYIGRKIEKRKLCEQKESAVYAHGIQIPAQKLKRARYREAYITSEAIFSAPSPKAPEGIKVCTPRSPQMDLAWNPSLPWLRFVSFFQPEIKLGFRSCSRSVPSSTDLNNTSKLANQDLTRQIVSIVPCNAIRSARKIRSSSDVAEALAIFMPEEFEGQHLALATDLSESKLKEKDLLILQLFLLSNNLALDGPDGISAMKVRLQDHWAMKMFNDSGWNDEKQLSILMSSREPTAEAIVEKLFATALRLRDLKTVERMLKAKMNPNTVFKTYRSWPRSSTLTALQFAVDIPNHEGLELVHLLLRYGADVNLSYNNRSPLNYAFKWKVSRNDVIQLLLAHGAIVTQQDLYIVFSNISDEDILIELVDHFSDVDGRAAWQNHRLLTNAIKYARVATIRHLLMKGADVNHYLFMDFDYEFVATTALGYAASFYDESMELRRLEIMRLLLDAGGKLNPDFGDQPCVSPLTVAVDGGHVEITKFLLERGAVVELADDEGEATLIERAAKKKNLKLCQLLLNYGARIERPVSGTEQKPSALLIAVKRQANDIVNLLIKAGARLNDEYSENDEYEYDEDYEYEKYYEDADTVLGAAIRTGNVSLVNTLFSKGAKIASRSRIMHIPTLETAVYLQEVDLLHGILPTSEEVILAEEVIQYLLEHDVDWGTASCERRTITPLRAAIKSGNLIFAEALLKRGAIVTDNDLAEAVDYLPCPDNGLLPRLLGELHGRAPTTVGLAILRKQELGIFRDAGVDPTGTPCLEDFRGDYYSYQHFHEDFIFETPASVLEIAGALNRADHLKLLLQWVDWDRKTSGRCLTISIITGHYQLVAELMEYGADMEQDIRVVYAKQLGGWWPSVFSPLQAAVKKQLYSLVEKLVPQVDPNYLGEGSGRRTPLQYAVENGDMDLINLLLRHGAKVDSPAAEDGGATALQIAAIKGWMGIARKLIGLGASVNEPPARVNGRTALQGAAEYGRIDMLHMLLHEGALVVGDGEENYKEAVRLAEKNGHYAAARMLRSFRDSVQLNTAEAI